jgi:Tol biopolymer transport system component
MPDFDTRRPQEQNVPNEPRIGLVANKLRSALMATWLRILFMGGGILLLVVAVTVGLLIYSTSRLADQQPFVLSYAGDIWTMNIDGSDRQQLTATDEFERFTVDSQPAWSPDHQRIAFVRSQEHEPPSGSGTPEEQDFLYVMNADGFWQRKLLDANASEPTWSPDGERIAFSADTSIYVMNSDGSSDPRRLTSAFAEHPAWSPDGKEIAFERGGDIYVMKACCGEYYTMEEKAKQLTAGPGEDREAVWSPDGRELAFVRDDNIYKMNPDGSGMIRLTNSLNESNGIVNDDGSPTWTPDGKKLAFIRGDYNGPERIYLMKSDGSQPTFVRGAPRGYEMDIDWR